MKKTLIPQQIELRKKAKNEKKDLFQNFFKTGPGQYGEGDIFIGVTVPDMRVIAKKYADTNIKDIDILLQSEIHEDRLLGLTILVIQYEKTKDLSQKKKIVQFYLKKTKRINNWDLVDLSAYKILGDYCFLTNNYSTLVKLSKSKWHWDRRISIVSTLRPIQRKKTDVTFKMAPKFLTETEDLMHKATGWMLREAGKKNFLELKKFITRFGKKMPRTMLRYAIEKFPENERKRILIETR
ncbi:MAG: DNA alkylation repair protein [Pseudobdellovibrio sp.]